MQKQLNLNRDKIIHLYLDEKTKWTYLKQGDLISIISDKGKKYKILKWTEQDYQLAKKRIQVQIESEQVKDYVFNNLWGIPQDDDLDL